jgi:Signal transduction histidine kinase
MIVAKIKLAGAGMKPFSRGIQQELHRLRYKQQVELNELKQRHHEEFHNLHQIHHGDFHDLHQIHHGEFRRLHRSLKFFRPVGLVLNLIILYLLFHWIGLKAIGVTFAFILIIKETFQLVFFWRLEKRVFKPIEQLKKGFAEIAKGNYHVSIDFEVENEFGRLIYSFNEMASKLRESEEMNAEYEENRKTLVANISHDLKTPITSIQGYLEMILEGNVSQPEKVSRYLRTIYNNTVYINKLIDDLFLFSKLDMEKLDFNFENIKLRAYMEDLSAEFKFELEEKQYAFSYSDKTDEDYSVNIDGKRVYQAIRNIIGNAVKYGPEENLKVTMELYTQDGYFCIDIKDNGPGIPNDRLPHIFNRFYRIDTERSKDFMSTGLGLAIAKELIEAQGGKISVSCKEETGSCFTIGLPIVK